MYNRGPEGDFLIKPYVDFLYIIAESAVRQMKKYFNGLLNWTEIFLVEEVQEYGKKRTNSPIIRAEVTEAVNKLFE